MGPPSRSNRSKVAVHLVIVTVMILPKCQETKMMPTTTRQLVEADEEVKNTTPYKARIPIEFAAQTEAVLWLD